MKEPDIVADPDLTPLPKLPRVLAEHTGKPTPSYRRLCQLTLDGRLPAEHDNGRWFVRNTEVPPIAATLGVELGR
jgi:hypothetical protein